MKYLVTISLILLLGVSAAFAGTVKGVAKDSKSGEPLIGANIVLVGTALGTTTDADGAFAIVNVPNGSYKIEVSYLGYQMLKQFVTVGGSDVSINAELVPITLSADAISVVANRATFRETPVAFSNIDREEIEKSLGSRDVPLVLNDMPGVYATESGGGAGDARINVRGFDQRNIAVLINGVPVNDMENGWVYWSNWDGLGDVTSSIQVQRGLGASSLAIPSVGGTINVATNAADQKAGVKFKQEYGSGNFLKETFSASTGQMDNGLAFTGAVVRKTGNGLVDQTWTDAWAYFGAINWAANKDHTIQFYAVGAPQQHGHRLYEQSIQTYDADYARKVYEDEGVSTEDINAALDGAGNYGRRYNPNWGAISDYDAADLQEYYNGSTHDFADRSIYLNGDKVSSGAVLMERENYYHKPQFNLNWYWNLNPTMTLSNIAYVSIGRGGGTGLKGFAAPATGQFAGQMDFQAEYDANKTRIDSAFSTTETKANTIVRNSVNNHNWYGLLSTLDIRSSSDLNIKLGLDARSYKGEHYRDVRNLLGGDYYLDFDDQNQASPQKRLGDKIDYFNDGLTRWLGGFLSLEKKFDNLILSGLGSVSTTGYKRKDYFVDPNAHLEEGSTILPTESDWVNFTGAKAMLGGNYNVNEKLNIYGNAGFITKAPIFDAVFNFTHQLYEQTFNEKIMALEMGTGLQTRKSQTNLNVYFTKWQDRSWAQSIFNQTTQNVTYFLLQGIDARHMGVELETTIRPNKFVQFNGAASLGDWIWQNDVEASFAPEDDPTNQQTFNVYADGLKVADAAQKTLFAAVTVYPTEGLYLNGSVRAYMDLFADFDPASRSTADDRSDPWKMPNYQLVDLHAGYTLPGNLLGNTKIQFFGHVFNLLDTDYVTDAVDGSNHDALSSVVYIGLERRFNVGINLEIQ